MIENTIHQLDSLGKISQLRKPEEFGENDPEKLFNVALRLAITWINRVLFLKLLEAQLIKYHRGDQAFSFLNLTKVKDYHDLNSLFFDVLAREQDKREAKVGAIFSNVPYLNSSLFEPTDIEQQTIVISNLRNEGLPIFGATVLADGQGKRRSGELNALEYLFAFLDAYDFSSDGSEDDQEDSEKLINASVLGLIFEKINGYKDGSFYTPSFITMYMCRETIRRAVVQKFNEVKGWDCENLDQLYEKITDKKEANTIINSLKICDPAVGSGHFLVSALNEMIAIKSELKVLGDRAGKSLRDYEVRVQNDKLVVWDEEGKLFEYFPKNKEKQRVQEALFHEKQTIIEGCLFGVDINPNSVIICRLRLWIELLKNAYYRTDGNLETLPNIDINIKCGNSLISRFGLDVDVKQVLKKHNFTIEQYRNAVQTYRNAVSKEQKREMEHLIRDIKGSFTMTLQGIDPNKTKLRNLEGELYQLENQVLLFEESAKEKKAREKKINKLNNEIDKLRAEIENIESGKLYENALEWRFEFPEVLNNKGDFIGFDIVIGNPPYGVEFSDRDKILYKKEYAISSQGKIDSFKLFYERAYQILKKNYYQSFIAPNTFLYNIQSQSLREFLLKNTHLLIGVELRKNIFEDAPDVVTVINVSKYTKPEKNSKTLVKVAYPDHSYSSIDNNKWEIDQIIPYSTFTDNADKKINLRRNFKLDEIIKKVNNIGNVVADFFELKQGTKPYGDKKKKSIELIANKKIDKNWENAINGRNISQYHINFENEYVKRCPELHTCLPENIINGEKIYFQRMRKISLFPRIVACYDDSSIHGLYTCSVIFSRIDSSEINLKYLLSILNSHLINIWYKNFDTDIEIKLVSVKQIPIPKISKEKQANLILLVDQILTAKKSDPKADTTALEKEIDQLVYQLYGLTEEEIKIVEGGK
ncbi:MAG: TaqI-like C-terminal specificity domain-containing protein [Snowella sp.]|nr:TaqI-like C-terminal specificity domain-containing protein [Snowella sp.]